MCWFQSLQVERPRGLKRLWEIAVLAPLGGRPDHPAKWVLLKDDERARRFIIRHGPLFQDNKGAHQSSCGFVYSALLRPSCCMYLKLRRATHPHNNSLKHLLLHAAETLCMRTRAA